MKLRPLRDRVVISPLAQNVTAGGIIIPDVAKDRQTAMGRVVQVGPGMRRDAMREERDHEPQELDGEFVPMDAKVGMLVLFMRYSGVEIMIDGKEFVMVRDHEILCIYEE
jgi:chaperonin GroES